MPNPDIQHAKQAVREHVWALLEQQGAVQPPGIAHGKIPNFVGAEQAAERLATVPAWRTATTMKAVPDKAQRPVRARALAAGKVVYMAVSKLAAAKPFYLLDPADLLTSPEDAADSKQASVIARNVGVDELQPVDLVICGSVAVNRHGARLGKGAGYTDIEAALLAEAGLLSERTTIVTTVHDLQVVDDNLPETDHDFHVDLIVTPTQVITCDRPKRPARLQWDRLSTAKVAAIPILTQMSQYGRESPQ